MSSDLLSAIVAGARSAADHREHAVPAHELDAAIAARPPQGERFRRSLTSKGVRVIAECKRRSPSKGVLRPVYDPVTIARRYAAAGAAAISVLTEPTFFDGALDHLRQIRPVVDVPLLRKDFVVTPYQVLEAAAAGADAVLLIVGALDRGQLKSLNQLAESLGLATLVEVHDRAELEAALQIGARVVGVNSRNLRTLQVDPAVLDRLGIEIPAGLIAVAESGLRTGEDLRRLAAVRYDAFLIGERFMTMADPGDALASVIASAETPV